MSVNTKVRIDHQIIDLIFQGKEHFIIFKEKSYADLREIVLACPELSDEDNLIPLAKVSNHILFGDQFKVIENVRDYINRYHSRLQKEKQTPHEDPEIRLFWIVPCKVEAISRPKVENDQFSCWLEDLYLGLPFELSFPFPYQKKEYTFSLKPAPVLAKK